TGGNAFIAGRVGERFMVRNSGATAVVEGVGDHGCEYMTGGVAVILGPTGRNFGAGMTNGRAFVYDARDGLSIRTNVESVDLERLNEQDAATLRAIIVRHVEATGSAFAQDILDRWSETVRKFWQVIPTTARELAQVADETEQEMAEGAAD
ncbi:MAG: hypothetical protein WKF81_13220, partial [Thermomicrobiales bacterium]